MKRSIRAFITIWRVILFSLLVCRVCFAQDFLEPERAFQLKAELVEPQTFQLRWTIAPGYKLYRERLAFQVEGQGITLGQALIPEGKKSFDSNLNERVQTYEHQLKITLPIQHAPTPSFILNITYQGCAEAGLCYPPISQAFRVHLNQKGLLSRVGETPSPSASSNEPNHIQTTLQSGHFLTIGLVFLGFGVLLSFTPCVLPMLPIVSSIIVGQGHVTRKKAFFLALSYCLGMACVYTALGVAAGLAGEGLASFFQTPAVIVGFAFLLVLLSLSMFEVYQLQLPAALQSGLNTLSCRFQGGHFLSVFLMGAVSSLMVSPCVAAPLAGALVYISQTHDILIGGWALFSMAMGMSVPLLLVGVSAGSLLPKTGIWMNRIKTFFGVMLIGVAIWMVFPVVSPFFKSSAQETSSGVHFERIKTLAELDMRLKTASQPVILDFYADWCVSCKEMARFTFKDPRVIKTLKRYTLLQVDVTANTPEDRALMKRFKVFGPPAMIFFHAKGLEQENVRVIGYLNAEDFLKHFALHSL